MDYTFLYTYTKLGDNLTNSDGDMGFTNCKPKLDVKYIHIYINVYSPFGEHAASGLK